MSLHVIIGAGPVGSATALRLAARGQRVRIITRSGTGPAADGVEPIAADATDAGRLASLTAGADVIYNCASPPYHRWPQDWPPLAAAVLAAAEQAGAVLVTMSNLYGYGPVGHPITERDPLAATGPKGRTRAAVWAQALAAHQAGRVRATEARASDFFGPGVRGQSPIGQRSIPRLLAGRPIAVLGDPDAAHSWTYVPDIAATLVTLGASERAWGHAWHVPASAPMSQREVYTALARLAGARAPRLRPVPAWLIRVGGLAVPDLRELGEVAYQFTAPFVVDSSAFTTAFGLAPTPADQALAATLGWWQRQGRSAARKE
jgi:nucleoside-diphosphate-sugar epimerase